MPQTYFPRSNKTKNTPMKPITKSISIPQFGGGELKLLTKRLTFRVRQRKNPFRGLCGGKLGRSGEFKHYIHHPPDFDPRCLATLNQ